MSYVSNLLDALPCGNWYIDIVKKRQEASGIKPAGLF
jgi:hypothetical protein